MKAMLHVTIALVSLIGVLLLVIRNLKNEIKLIKTQLATSETEKDGYAKQVQRLTSAAEITAEIRKECEEKNATLYSGDPVDNAIEQLSKSKS